MITIIAGIWAGIVGLFLGWNYLGKQRRRQHEYADELADAIHHGDPYATDERTDTRITECDVLGVSFLSPFGECPTACPLICVKARMEVHTFRRDLPQ